MYCTQVGFFCVIANIMRKSRTQTLSGNIKENKPIIMDLPDTTDPVCNLVCFSVNEIFMTNCSVDQVLWVKMGSGASKAQPHQGLTEDMIDKSKYMVVKNSQGEVRLSFKACVMQRIVHERCIEYEAWNSLLDHWSSKKKTRRKRSKRFFTDFMPNLGIFSLSNWKWQMTHMSKTKNQINFLLMTWP